MKFKRFQITVWGKRIALLFLFIFWLLPVLYLLGELATIISTPSENGLHPADGVQSPRIISTPSGNGFGHTRAILLTLAAWVGVPFLIWRTVLADKQTHINRESHYTELFAKAVELLSATRLDENGTLTPAIESRIGAIFALERLAKHSQIDYGNIIETLSSYICEQCGKPSTFVYSGESPDADDIPEQEQERRRRAWCEALWIWIKELKKDPPANRMDVMVALKVLSRRKEGRNWTGSTEEEIQPNLSGANLQGAGLGAITKGLVQEDTGISSAYLEGAQLSGFDLANSSVLRPHMQHEISIGSYKLVPKQLVGATLIGLTLKDAEFFPILDSADLSYAHMDEAKCNEAFFRGARLAHADFEKASVRNAKFEIADARTAKFDYADLHQTDFRGAILRDATFIGANLSYTTFRGAYLRGVKFEGALFIETNLAGAMEVEAEMIEKAFGTADTPLPNGLVRPEHWKDEISAVEQWKAFRNKRGIQGELVKEKK